MKNVDLILRTIVFFLFPVPFILGFATAHGNDWTGYLGYVAAAALVLAATVAGWSVSRRRGGS